MEWYGRVKQFFSVKIAIIFLFINLYMCFGCSKELSHRDGSFEYPQHMFWLSNKKNNFLLHTLIWGPVGAFSGSKTVCNFAKIKLISSENIRTPRIKGPTSFFLQKVYGVKSLQRSQHAPLKIALHQKYNLKCNLLIC